MANVSTTDTSISEFGSCWRGVICYTGGRKWQAIVLKPVWFSAEYKLGCMKPSTTVRIVLAEFNTGPEAAVQLLQGLVLLVHAEVVRFIWYRFTIFTIYSYNIIAIRTCINNIIPNPFIEQTCFTCEHIISSRWIHVDLFSVESQRVCVYMVRCCLCPVVYRVNIKMKCSRYETVEYGVRSGSFE